MQNSSQFKNHQQPIEEPVLEETEVVCEEKVPVIGVVVNCQKLRVRSEASAEADNTIAVLDALSEVTVDEDASTEDFYKVCTAAGMEGFCMKKFIALRR